MGKGKLAKFADMRDYPHVFEYPYSVVDDVPFDMKGNWNRDFFKNDNPIVLELGCGRGEYTVGLGRMYPDKNFIGVDIKGARLWKGAKYATENALPNVAFLRTRIEFITSLFAENEVSEIWVTFADPQPNKPKKRLTSHQFLAKYKTFLKPDGIIHLKTDSILLHESTLEVIREGGHKLLEANNDIYAPESHVAEEITSIKTFYESQFLAKGMPITYLKFVL